MQNKKNFNSYVSVNSMISNISLEYILLYIHIFIYLGSYVTAALPSYNRAYHTGNTGIQ